MLFLSSVPDYLFFTPLSAPLLFFSFVCVCACVEVGCVSISDVKVSMSGGSYMKEPVESL